MALINVADSTLTEGFRHLPPHSIEAETSVLGALLLDVNAINRVFEILSPQMFYISAHQEIYRAMIDLHLDSLPTDIFQVCNWLADKKLLEKVGGKGAIARLIDEVLGSHSVDLHAELVADKWRRRRMIETSYLLATMAHDPNAPWPEILEKAQREIFDLTPSAKEAGLKSMEDLLVSEMTAIEDRAAGTAPIGLKTGFYDLDEKLGGLRPGQLVIAAGRPAMGKSAFAGAVARNIAGEGKPAAIFSLEMSSAEVVRRFMSSESSVEGGKLSSGNVPQADWENLGHGFAALAGLPIYIDESENVAPSHILTQCRALKAKHGELGVVVIDYLHLMMEGDDEVRELSKITRACKRMARALNTPVILLSQLSRAVESRQNKRPVMSDLRSSGAIEQDADLVLMLYRDEYYDENSSDRGIAEVIVAKNRSGATGTAKLLFEPQFTRFRNLAH